MSVLIIDGGDRAALYCDTDDEAFGPVFGSREHAEDFLDWLQRLEGLDPRAYGARTLRELRERWFSERCDDEGDLLEREGATA